VAVPGRPGIAGRALFLPGSSHHTPLDFTATFQDARWGNCLEWQAIRSNVRIVLISVGLCLLLEGIGLWLLQKRRPRLGNFVFLLYAAPLAGLLLGGYYFLKAVFLNPSFASAPASFRPAPWVV
jgi:hypothetical protein